MEKKLSCSIEIHEEELSDGKKVFVADCIELGVSDFGDTINEALENLKEAIKLLLEEIPEKKELLEKEGPIFVSRIFL